MSKRRYNQLRVIGAWTLFGGFLLLLLFMGDQAMAQTATDTFGLEQARVNTGLGSADLRTIIANIIRVALTLLGIVALVIFIYGGFLYMTSRGAEDQISRAKKLMINGAIGIAIILSAYAITAFVLSRLGAATGFTGTTGSPGSQNCSSPAYAAANPALCGGGGFNPCIGNSTQGPFVVRAITPSAPNASAGHNNVGIRVLFNTSVNVSFSPDQAFTILRDGVDVTNEFNLTYLNNSFRTVVEAVVNDLAGTGAPFQALPLTPGSYEVQVNPNLTNNAGGALQTNTQCGTFPLNSRFRVDPADVQDVTPPTVGQITYNGLLYGGVIALPVGGQHLIESTITDDNGIGYVSIQINSVGANGSSFTVYDGPLVGNGSASPYQFIYPLLLAANTQPGQLYDVIITAVDTDHNSTQLQSQFITVGSMCQLGSGAGNDPSCRGNGACSNNAQCLSGVCNQQTGQCVNLPTIIDVSPWTAAGGNFVSIIGNAFGSAAGTVEFGVDTNNDGILEWVPAALASCGQNISTWNDGYIVVEVPRNDAALPDLSTSTIRVTTAVGGQFVDTTTNNRGPLAGPNQGFFTKDNSVRTPGLCQITVDPGQQSPAGGTTGLPGDAVTALGISFTNVATGNSLTFGGVQAQTGAWSDAQISATIPTNMQPGQVGAQVTVNGISSNGVPFTIASTSTAQQPVIESISPSSTTVGSYVTALGQRFGDQTGVVYLAPNITTNCAVGGCSIMNVTLPAACGDTWSDTQVVFAVPQGTTAGTYFVVVENAFGQLSSPQQTDQLIVTAGGPRPSICALSPSAGPAPLPASSQGLDITGVNFSNLPTVYFWGRGASQGALGTWLQSAVTAPANVNTTIQTVTGNDGLPVDVINTIIPTQNGYSMQTGPILIQNSQGINSNGVQYAVADCRNLDPAQIPGGSQCCGTGPDAGVIIPNGQICAGQPRDAGYVWRFTTGKIASVPYVIESCSNAGLPSPSPARLWEDGEQTCINASIVVRFNLPMNITNNTPPASIVRVLTCGNGPEPDCSIGNATDITNQVQLVHQASSQGSILYLRQVPPAANMLPNTWYHVEVLDTLQSNEFVEVLGQNQVRNQPIVPTRPCAPGTAYCFDFKTSVQSNLCTLTNVGIEPPAFTTRRLGTVLDPRFPVDQNAPLNYYIWGQGDQACTALAVDGLGWQWATAGLNAIAARATANPGPNYIDSRANADAYSNTAPQDVTIEASAPGGGPASLPQTILYDGLQSLGVASLGPVLPTDPVSSIPDPNGNYAITTGNTGTTTITLRTRHPNESPINTANGWPAGPNNGVVIKTDTILVEGGAYRIWEQRFGRVGQNLPYRRLTRFSKMNNTPFITVNIDILPTANWSTYISANAANITFPNTAYDPNLPASTYHIVRDGNFWRVPDTEFLDETEYQIVEDAQGCRVYWSNVVQSTPPVQVGTCNNTNLRTLPYGPLVFGAGGNNAANVSRAFDYDGTITRFTVQKITPPAAGQAAGLVASSSLIVDLGPPRVTSFFPDCAEACINANLGMNFSRQMSTSSYQTGVRLYRCQSEVGCDATNLANLITVPITLQNQGNFSADNIRFNPVNNLQPNTWYLITAGYLAQMPSMEIDPTNPTLLRPSQTEFLQPFASRFRTKNDPTPCIASNVSVLPSPFTAFLIGEQTRYDAYPYGAPDACNIEGQELNPWGFGWQWQSLDTQIAQVSSFVTPASPRSVCTSGCRPAGSDIQSNAYPPGNVPGVCGNGTVDPGEDCDISDPNAPATCTLNCLDTADPDQGTPSEFDPLSTSSAWCGSGGTPTAGEDCEPGVNGDVLGVTCSANCLNLGTALSQAWCDNNPNVQINNVPASQSPECAAAQSICGNGVVEAGEECEIIGGVVEVFDPTNPTASIVTNAQATSCNTQCKLVNICLTDVPTTFRCDPTQEGCSPGCTLRGSSPFAYSTPSLCGDGLDVNGQAGIGEFAWCEYTQQEIAQYTPAGQNPTQVVTAIGQGTVTNGQQQTQIEATLSGVRVAPGQQQPPLNATIVGVGDYALQCGYTSYVGRSANNLVLWLTGDGDATDIAGSNDAIVHGGITYVPGRFGQAFQFDGVDGYLEVPADTTLDFGAGDYTISMWHRTSEQNLQMNIFGRGPFTPGSPPAVGPPNTTEAILNRGATQGPLAYLMYGASGAQTAQSTRIQQVTNDDQWYHVAYVRRGLTTELHINGVLIGQSLFPNSRINLGAMYGADQPWYFGIPMVAGSFFTGLMDEIQMYNRALSSTEIQTLATSGAQPGTISNNAATSGAGTGTQALNTATGRVNDCPDPRHGVGRNSCCYPRPTRTQEYPVDGSGLSAASAPVCRNTYISVTFDGEIDEATVFNNFSIARGYTAADNTSCSAQGLVDISPELAPTLAFGQGVPPTRPEGFWKSLWNNIKSFFVRLFAPSANASQFRVPTVTNWCVGAISAVPELTYARDANSAIVSTTVAIYIDQLLDPNAIYAVLLRGGEAGITNVEGVGIGNPLPTGPATFDSFVFQTGQDVCKLASIDVTPSTQLFNTPNQSHQFQAITQSTNGQQIVPIVGVYDWRWTWTPTDDAIFAIPANQNSTNSTTIFIASRNVEGERTASVHASVTSDVSTQSNHVGRVFSASTELRAIFCENPWPAAAFYPFQDTTGNRSAYNLVTNQFTGGTIPPATVGGSPVQFNFSMGYCADAGASGNIGDDLPYLRVSVPDVSSQAAVHPTIPGGLRKYLFFSDINSDAIGIQIFQNPRHLPLSRWFAEEAGLGSPTGFQTVQVDGYQALANGNNLYVNALNEDTTGNVYTNVYLFSINENASDDTRQVYNQLIQSLRFNINITNIGYCSNNGNINMANPASSTACSTDFDCRNPDGSPLPGTGGVCANARTKLQRDWSRLARVASIQDRLASYQLANTTVPQLATGSFIPGQTLSRWSSWGAFSDAIGGAARDPINEWSACGVCVIPGPGNTSVACASDSDCTGAGNSCQIIDQSSCWNAPTSEFVCPVSQSVTTYQATGIASYQLHTPFEYLQLSNQFVQTVLPDPASVVTAPVCTPLQIISPFGGQSCGDGIVGPGEQCDPPGMSVLGTATILSNGILGQCPIQNGVRQQALATCTATCQWQYGQCQAAGTCGNGIVEGAEVCDDGALNGQYGQCNTTCSSANTTYCGNGVVDTAIAGGRTVQLEQCDIGQAQYQLGFCDKQSCQGTGRYQLSNNTPSVTNLSGVGEMAKTPNGTVHTIAQISPGGAQQSIIISETAVGAVSQSAIPIGANDRPFTITFIDDQRGWVTLDVAGDGAIARTVDAGSSWSLVPVPIMSQNPIIALAPVSAQTVFAIGKRTLILSTDGGGTWNTVQTPSISQTETFNDIYFVDTQNGWIVGDGGLILRTTDGGASWQRTPSGTTVSLNEVKFSSSLIGMIAARNTILRTTDGGASWNQITPAFSGFTYTDLDFVDDNVWAFLPVSENSGRGLQVTLDGGGSWLTYGSGTQGYSVLHSDVLIADINTIQITGSWSQGFGSYQPFRLTYATDPYCQSSTSCSNNNVCQNGDVCITSAAPLYHPVQANTCSYNCQSTGAYCGDGNIDAPYEQCDDANNNDTDACTNICTINSSLPSVTNPGTGPRCGDGTVDAGEVCDLGNRNGVACIPGYNQSCTYCAADCQNILTVDATAYCGNNQLEPQGGEVCESLGNGQITTSTSGAVAQCSDVVNAWHSSLEIRGSFTCSNQCQTASNNCVACGFGGALSPFNLPRPQVAMLNPLYGNIANSPELMQWSQTMSVGLSSSKQVPVVGNSLNPNPNGTRNDRPWYRYTDFANDPRQPQFVFHDYSYTLGTSQPRPVGAGTAAGIESDQQCSDFYLIHFANRNDEGNAYFDGLAASVIDPRRGDFFPYPVLGEAKGTVVYNEYMVVPTPRLREIRVVIRWTDVEDQQSGNGLFLPNLYGITTTIPFAGTANSPRMARYVDALPSAPASVRNNQMAFYCDQYSLISSNDPFGNGGYLDPGFPVQNGCLGSTPQQDGQAFGVHFHPFGSLQNIFAQATTMHTSQLVDGATYAFFVEAITSGQQAATPIKSFDRSAITVEIYEYHQGQQPGDVYAPTQVFRITDAAGTSNNPLARYWHPFNITRVGNSYTVTPINSIETGFSEIQCNIPGHPGC